MSESKVDARISYLMDWVKEWPCYTPGDLWDMYEQECDQEDKCWLHYHTLDAARIVHNYGEDEGI